MRLYKTNNLHIRRLKSWTKKTNFKTEAAKSEDGSTIQLEELDQVLIPSSEEEDGDNPEFAASNENPDPAKFTVVTDTDPVTGKTRYNARSYTMIIWIDETGSDQTEDDSGKIFTAGITFTTANEKIGVSGFISAADDASKN